MPPSNRERWAERQISALLEMGDDLADAEKFVRDALEMVPRGEDPETYVPPAMVVLRRAKVTAADITDARAEWYASEAVPAVYKRILDAQEREE